MAALRGSCLGGLALGGLACVFLSFSAFAATPPSGVAIAVVQQAEATGGAGNRVLQTNGPVYSGDAIVTGPIGQAQVKFRDNTKLVVGPNSRLVIDAFVFSGNTARKLSINALKGAFRFISGNSRHDAYEIRTPTATIGVRGTEIDVSVSTGVVIYSGAADVCERGSTNSKNCVRIEGGCSLATFRDNQRPRKINAIADRNALLLQNFELAVNQRPLLPEFRANTASCGVLRASVVAPGSNPPPPVVVPPPTPPPPKKCDFHKPHHPFHGKDHDRFKKRHWPDHKDKKLGRRSGHHDRFGHDKFKKWPDHKDKKFGRRGGDHDRFDRNKFGRGDDHNKFKKWPDHSDKKLGRRGGDRNKFGRDGGDKNRFGRDGGDKNRFGRDGGDKNKFGRDGGDKNKFGRDGGDKNKFGRDGGDKNKFGRDGGDKNKFGRDGGDKNKFGRRRPEKFGGAATRTSSVAVAATRTSSVVVAATRTSSVAVAATRTSSVAVAATRTSSVAAAATRTSSVVVAATRTSSVAVAATRTRSVATAATRTRSAPAATRTSSVVAGVAPDREYAASAPSPSKQTNKKGGQWPPFLIQICAGPVTAAMPRSRAHRGCAGRGRGWSRAAGRPVPCR